MVATLSETVREGRFLNSGDSDAMVLGESTARALGATVGSDVALVTQGADGYVTSVKWVGLRERLNW